MKSKAIKSCLDCGVDISGAHSNRKRCQPCAKTAISKPAGSMTEAQVEKALSLRGKMPRDEICKELGVSVSNLKRSTPGVSWWYFNKHASNPETVKMVCDYYERHGKKKTAERFPDLRVRSIVERYYKGKPRQSRWTPDQLVELVKMAGIISMEDQAKYFNRPMANRGSIISAWQKKFNCKQAYLHGFPAYKAKIFVKKSCPSVEIDFNPDCKDGKPAKIYLWCDVIKHLRADCPEFIKEATLAMASFQKKLLGAYPKREIKRMLRERKTT